MILSKEKIAWKQTLTLYQLTVDTGVVIGQIKFKLIWLTHRMTGFFASSIYKIAKFEFFETPTQSEIPRNLVLNVSTVLAENNNNNNDNFGICYVSICVVNDVSIKQLIISCVLLKLKYLHNINLSLRHPSLRQFLQI
ncbi:hypothetical protein T4B_10402 [Trichinella pseudospiralis]|nr:hypothetical protein T4A_6152 [Trichinella pseudospiralis]KRZ19880.1 hypothetical protein T4B_10402 [Trichinella pseudospiralis]